ncbi:MAG: ATP-binding response regulator [Anaerolineae bacterium]
MIAQTVRHGATAAGLSREEARQRCGSALSALTFVAGAAAWWYYGTAPFMDGVLFFTAVALTLTCMLTYAGNDRSHRAASGVLVGAGALAVAVAVWHTRTPESGFLFVGPLLMAGTLLQPAAAAAFACLAAPYLWLALGQQAPLPAATLLFTGAAVWMSLSARDDLLGRLSNSSQDAVYLAEQLRDQRGQLNRAIRDLDSSYQWLQQSNRELALARQEADQLREMRSRFATNLSHELRTPLNIILGFSQLIYVNPELYGYSSWSQLLLHDLSEVQRNAGYLSQLVSDIVDLARVDAMAMPIRKQLTQLPQVIDDAIGTVASLARDKALSLTAAYADSLPQVHVDPMRIRQVLFNLVTNAIRCTDRGGVTIGARVEGKEVVVSVADTGRGIPTGELETIFNEYYQVGRPKEGADAGKGLGLAIAKRFVQLHGGRIWAESTAGEGSTFSFSLPLTAKSVGLLGYSGPAPLPKAGAKPCVLVLDEDGTAAGYLARRIGECDFVATESPEELAAAVGQHHPLAVVTGGPLPGGDGQCWQQPPEWLPENATLIQCSLPTTRWLAPDHQFAAMVSKPVSGEQLLRTVLSVLPELATAKVLVVDDDRGFAQLVTRLLACAPGGAPECSLAYSGEEALRRMARVKPDLVLMDLVMPDMSGFEVLRRMRADPAFHDTPAIAVSAATPGEDQLAATGANFTLLKRQPFQPGELVRLLVASLGLASGEGAAAADTA